MDFQDKRASDTATRVRIWALAGATLGILAAIAATGAMADEASGADSHMPIPAGLHYYQPYHGPRSHEVLNVDICVYGGTSAGVIAAVQAARLGRSVVLLEPGQHLGGMTASGLSWTDFGNTRAIGGMALEFYKRCGQAYGRPVEWAFEPHVATQVFNDMIAQAGVPVRYGQFLKSVHKQGQRIVSLHTETGLTVRAAMFIDTTYEGDLMAKAGVSFFVGREANSVYGETMDGVQLLGGHQFDRAVDPYKVPGDPASGLLPGIEPGPPEPRGTGDRYIQAYNFRLCLTTNPDDRIPFAKPAGYDPRQYELLARLLTAGWAQLFSKFDPIEGGKFDKNNYGAISTDFIGMNYGWPNGSYRQRERIFQAHVVYTMGLFWFLSHDPRVPEAIRERMSTYGLCKDEFKDTGGWPFQLYVREARRMVSDVVMTEHNVRGQVVAPDSVGLASYGMDSHNCERVVKDGRVWNEGNVEVGGNRPFPISYRAIIPRRGQCENLIVPACLSASHIAYGSIRMEPVFMALGQSAGIAASLACQEKVAVQDLPYVDLHADLEKAGQVLDWPPGSG